MIPPPPSQKTTLHDRRAFLRRSILMLASASLCAASPLSSFAAPPLPDNLDSLIGQMLMLGFRGESAGEENPVLREIRSGRLGGIILFDRDVVTGEPGGNIRSPSQLRELTRRLQEAAPEPLLIAIDQEGGKVSRLRKERGFPEFPSAQSLGETGSQALSREVARNTARTLASCGVNFNLAPVVDLASNPDNPVIARYGRSFSAAPATVARHAREVILGHRQEGVLCALKHFPGHGSSGKDSHLEMVDVTRSWAEEELSPYRRLIAEGLAEAVMTAHVFNARLDPQYPATLSVSTIGGLLRRDMGFEGVVISDDMQMAAISRHYGLEKALELAINAGVDLLLFANTNSDRLIDAPTAVGTIRRLVESGRVHPRRIAEAAERVRRMKGKLPRREEETG